MESVASLAVSHHGLAASSARWQPRPSARLIRMPRLIRSVRLRIAAASSSSSPPSWSDHAAAGLEWCMPATPAPATAPPEMKGGRRGTFGAVTLEKAKLDLSQKKLKGVQPEDDGGCDYFMWCDARSEAPPSDEDSKSDSQVLMPCPYQDQGLSKDHLFELFLNISMLEKCSPLIQRVKSQPAITTYMVPGAKEVKHRSYKRASPFAQDVARLIVLFVNKLQLSGWTLNGDFKLSDFYITPFGMFVMSAAKLSSLVKSSELRNKLDFLQVNKIILDDIFVVESENQLPIDFKIFAGILCQFEENNRYLVINSAAFMTQEDLLRFVSKMFKKLTALEKTNLEKHNEILEKLPYIDPKITEGEDMYWKLRAETYNKYLSYHLRYDKVPGRPEKAKGKEAVEDVEEEEEEEGELGNKYPAGGKGQVKLIRNCDQHLHERHSLLKVRPGTLAVSFGEPGANASKSEYHDRSEPPEWIQSFEVEEVGFITDEAFPGSVIILQKAMHEAGELDKAL